MRPIDADALKEAFYQKMGELMKSPDTPQICNEALGLLCGTSLIIEAPTIEVEAVKHGRWSHYYDDVLVSGTCSVCGWQSMVMETDVADMPYCPNCGAKMNAEEGEIKME